MDRVTEEQLLALKELAGREPEEALALLRDYEARLVGDPSLVRNSGGLLIDIGTDLDRPDLVQDGVQRIEDIVRLAGDDSTLFYNLANGYLALAALERRRQGTDYMLDPDRMPLVRAKHYYRKALDADESDNDQRAQQQINYGNCLSGLGRAVEAISAYGQALALIPGHPMAVGNLGVELQHFARVANHSIFLLDAQQMLEEALSSNRLEQYGGPGARHHFEQARQRVTETLSKLGIDSKAQAEYKLPILSSDYQRKYVEFCARHQLFLNFCLTCRKCGRYASDGVSFSLITAIDDNSSFVRLSRVINEVKERYAFARLLLFQALTPLMDTVPIDGMTTYTDNLDYAVYGARAASLKLAFEGAFNILDKIAHFINSYLRLGVKPGPGIAFGLDKCVWRKGDRDSLRPELVRLGNWHLFALYDLARDLHFDHRNPERSGYWGGLRRTRNALTHEYLILHIEGMHWTDEADGERLHVSYHEFVDQVLRLLQAVRAAVIYLIAFIDLEEWKKRQSSPSKLLAPMFAPQYDAALFTPTLDSWRW